MISKNIQYCFLLCFIAFSGCFYTVPKHTLTKVGLGNGKLIIKYTSPLAPFGPHGIYFYHSEKGNTKEEFLNSTTLYNDGANLHDDNVVYTVTNKNEIYITMIGQEQQPEKWVFKYNDREVVLKKVVK